MVMSVPVMAHALRDRLPALWRRIEDAHYSYLEIEDSPEKLKQRDKLEGYITEYLSLVPHECKFGLAETEVVFRKTVCELKDFSGYRAGLGWAAIARYAANLLAQPWRTEYKVIRLYSGYYKHEVEGQLAEAGLLLAALGYRARGAGQVALAGPACPDTAAALARDALIAHRECQIMCQIWEAVSSMGVRVTWEEIFRERTLHAGDVRAAVARLTGDRRVHNGSEIYSNVPMPAIENNPYDPRYQPCNQICEEPIEEPITPMIHPPYVIPNMMPHMIYPAPSAMPEVIPQVVMSPYGVPYYYPVQTPYLIPTPAYAPVKHANTVPVNGFQPQCRYPTVPTGQLIDIDTSVYENGKINSEDRHRKRGETSRRNSTSKSGFSDVTLPSLSRSDTQPSLSKAREDGMGTYESWDYVFRNLSSKDEGDRNRFSPSVDRDSRTLDRLDRDDRKGKYHPTTLDLEDGLQALNLDRTYDEEMYRTAKVNENLMRLKQEQERKIRIKKAAESKRKIEPVANPQSDALVPSKVAPDKVKLLTKKDIKDRKDVIRQQSVNGTSNAVEVRRMKKPVKEAEKPRRPSENGVYSGAHSSKSPAQNYDIKAQLIVSLDEVDNRQSPTRIERPSSRNSIHDKERRDRVERREENGKRVSDKWECGTCTYLNKGSLQACEMCGKSRKGPEIRPLTSGGRECPACTLVNQRDARVCDACGSSLEHCPTYI